MPGFPEAFVIGDMAAVSQQDGKPVPGVAPAAMQMANHVAKLIQKELSNACQVPRPAFRYRDKGTLATIGRSAAVAIFGKLKLHGFLAWLAWLIVHLVFLIGFRNKLSVLLAWMYSYFTHSFGARIITEFPEPVSPSKTLEQTKVEPESLRHAA